MMRVNKVGLGSSCTVRRLNPLLPCATGWGG